MFTLKSTFLLNIKLFKHVVPVPKECIVNFFRKKCVSNIQAIQLKDINIEL